MKNKKQKKIIKVITVLAVLIATISITSFKENNSYEGMIKNSLSIQEVIHGEINEEKIYTKLIEMENKLDNLENRVKDNCEILKTIQEGWLEKIHFDTARTLEVITSEVVTRLLTLNEINCDE